MLLVVRMLFMYAAAVADVEDIEAVPVKKATAAVGSEDEDEEYDNGEESEAASEDYEPGDSDIEMPSKAAPFSSAQRSQRDHKTRTRRHLMLDSDDDCSADVSPVSGNGKGKGTEAAQSDEEIDEDDEVEAADDEKEEEPENLTWSADAHRPRSAPSRSPRSVSGGSSTLASLVTGARSRILVEENSELNRSGSIKRGCSAIDCRSQQQSEAKRQRKDLSEAASKAGMSVEELHILAAAKPAEFDENDDTECMVCLARVANPRTQLRCSDVVVVTVFATVLLPVL